MDETARQSAENARNFWEDYSASKAYAVGNKVASAGSSYLCIKPCTDIAPPNAEYWRLIAAKGNDGKGAPADAAPKAAGTANAGVLETYSRSDHVHPQEVSNTDRTNWNGKSPGSVTVTFTANDWTGDDEPFTLTIPKTSHKRGSADFTFDAYSLCSDGKYAKNTWAVLELDVEYTAATGSFKLMSDTKFAGKIVFAG